MVWVSLSRAMQGADTKVGDTFATANSTRQLTELQKLNLSPHLLPGDYV